MQFKRLLLALSLLNLIGFTNIIAQTKDSIATSEVKYLKTKLIELNAYTPSKDFLQKNPQFTVDGSYELNSALIPDFSSKKIQRKILTVFTFYIGEKMFLGTPGPAFSKTINQDSILVNSSKNYPVKKLAPTNKLAFLNNSVKYALLSTDLNNAGKFHSDDISKVEILKVSSIYGINDFEVYSNLAYEPILPMQLKKADQVFLSFSVEKIVPLASDIFGVDYPSCAMYKLEVDDVTGAVLKTYHQAVFFTCKYRFSTLPDQQFVTEYVANAKVELSHYLMPAALQGAIAQMANDDAFISQLKDHQNQLLKKNGDDPDFVAYINAKNDLELSQYRKQKTLANIAGINQQLVELHAPQLAAVGTIDLTSFSNVNSHADATMSTIGNIANAGMDAMALSKQKKQIEMLNNNGQTMITYYNKLKSQQQTMINAQTPGVIQKLADQNLFQKDADLATVFEQSKSNLAQSSAKATGDLNAVKKDYAAQLSNVIAMAETELIAMPGSPTGSSGLASRNNQVADIRGTECANQADKEWKTTAEYKTWQQSGGDANNYFSIAALGKLYLKYCKDKLNPKQKATIEKLVKDSTADGNAIRNTHSYSFGK